jgi:hypothetical protein
MAQELQVIESSAECDWETIQTLQALQNSPTIRGELAAGRPSSAALLGAIKMTVDQSAMAKACGLCADAPLPAIVTCTMKKGVEEERVRLQLPPGVDPTVVAVRKYYIEHPRK